MRRLKNFGNLFKSIGSGVCDTIFCGWDELKKWQSKELCRLAKKEMTTEPTVMTPEPSKGKKHRGYTRDMHYKFTPKMKENKYINRNYDDE